MRKLVIVGVLGLASLAVVPAHGANQSAQACAGTSSVSNGTWTFTAGHQWADFGGVHPADTLCSFATSYPIDPEGQFFNATGLVDSTLALQGSGDFSCANGGNGTLASPPLEQQQGSRSNILHSAAAGGGGGSAYVVWTASFSGGVGELTGTLYADQDWSAEPQPVQGVITVDCADPTGGTAANTSSRLTMETMPHSGSHPRPGFGLAGYHGCVATAGYFCSFEGNAAGIPNGVASATSGSWAVTHQAGGATVTDVSGSGPTAFSFPFANGVFYTLIVGTDGAGAVTAGSPR